MEKFQRSKKIQVQINSFTGWIKNQSIETIVFSKDKARFIENDWEFQTNFSNSTNQIFLFGFFHQKYIKISLNFQTSLNTIAGEIRCRSFNKVYELLGLFHGVVVENGKEILISSLKDTINQELWKEEKDEKYTSKELRSLVEKEYLKMLNSHEKKEEIFKKTKDYQEWEELFQSLNISLEYINSFLEENLKKEDLIYLIDQDLHDLIPNKGDRIKLQKKRDELKSNIKN